MTDAVKKSFKSALVLIIVALVAVTLIVLGNALFPKYQPKLDLATVGKLNGLVGVGVDDETALNDGYFRIMASDAKDDEFDVPQFNKDMRKTHNRTVNDSLLAVYSVEKGDKEGSLIVETTSRGFGSQDTVLLIAFDKSGTVTAVKAEYSSNDYYASYYAELNSLVGKKAGDSFDVVRSGATESSKAVTFGVNLAFGAVSKILGGAK